MEEALWNPVEPQTPSGEGENYLEADSHFKQLHTRKRYIDIEWFRTQHFGSKVTYVNENEHFIDILADLALVAVHRAVDRWGTATASPTHNYDGVISSTESRK
jgi:hypothetical protein